MEVVYFYVKNYLGLEEKEYNFHEKYNFSFNRQEEVLYCNEIAEEIPKNFFGERVISASAIVGKNGSGKTRILNFLYTYLNLNNRMENFGENKYYKFNIALEEKSGITYIMVLKREGKFYIKSNIFKNENNIQSNAYYYSNIFDYNEGIPYKNYYEDNLKNLSISEEIFKESRSSKNIDMEDIFNRIKIQSDMKQIGFIKELKNEQKELYNILEKEILIPNGIKVVFPYFENHRNLDDKVRVEFEIFAKENINKEKEIDMEKIIFYSKKIFCINLLSHIGKTSITNCDIAEVEKKCFNFLLELDHILKKCKMVTINNEKIEVELDLELSETLINLIEKVKEESIELRKGRVGLRYLISRNINILNYAWDVPLSSGEKGMLRLYSTFHKALKEEKGTVILLIDELDATFHPEWQRKSLYLLLLYLNSYSKYLNSNLRIQLIVSSHSPFLVADIPKGKIIALDENGRQQKRFKLKTFGSNILNIYKEGMFLDTTFGEFARQKIKKVIKNLEGLAIEDEQMEESEIQKIINMIGENLIRERLQRRYNEVFTPQSIFEDLEEKVKKLSSEEKRKLIKELEKNLDK